MAERTEVYNRAVAEACDRLGVPWYSQRQAISDAGLPYELSDDGLHTDFGTRRRVAGLAASHVVTLCDVLEHIPNPLVTLRKLHRWMNPGGLVFVRGPLNNSLITGVKEWLRRIAGVDKQLSGYPLDANTFNPKSLTAALQTAGFSGVRWVTQTAGFGEVVANAG